MFESLFSSSALSLERLRTLCSIVESGSIAKAAGYDANTASLYSRHVKDLQQFIGTKLLIRKGKTVQPTAAGLELVSKSQAFFKSLEDMQASTSAGLQRFSVGAGEAAIYWLIFPRLRNLQNAYPSACYEFENLRTSDIHLGLQDSRLDLGIVRSDTKQKGFEYFDFGTLDFALFVPSSQISRAPRNPLTLLAKIPLGILMGSGRFNRELTRSLEAQSIEAQIALRTESFPMLKEALKSQPLAAFLPTPAEKEMKAHDYRMFRLKGLDFLSVNYSAVYHLGSADIRQSIRHVALKWQKSVT